MSSLISTLRENICVLGVALLALVLVAVVLIDVISGDAATDVASADRAISEPTEKAVSGGMASTPAMGGGSRERFSSPFSSSAKPATAPRKSAALTSDRDALSPYLPSGAAASGGQANVSGSAGDAGSSVTILADIALLDALDASPYYENGLKIGYEIGENADPAQLARLRSIPGAIILDAEIVEGFKKPEPEPEATTVSENNDTSSIDKEKIIDTSDPDESDPPEDTDEGFSSFICHWDGHGADVCLCTTYTRQPGEVKTSQTSVLEDPCVSLGSIR